MLLWVHNLGFAGGGAAVAEEDAGWWPIEGKRKPRRLAPRRIWAVEGEKILETLREAARQATEEAPSRPKRIKSAAARAVLPAAEALFGRERAETQPRLERRRVEALGAGIAGIQDQAARQAEIDAAIEADDEEALVLILLETA